LSVVINWLMEKFTQWKCIPPACYSGISVNFFVVHDVTSIKRAENEYERLLKSEQEAHRVAEILRAANLALARDLNLDAVLEIFLEYLQQLIPMTAPI